MTLVMYKVGEGRNACSELLVYTFCDEKSDLLLYMYMYIYTYYITIYILYYIYKYIYILLYYYIIVYIYLVYQAHSDSRNITHFP